uniref:Lamin n=1 Tax=Syphacia muris TaxID=451379 RepID=A0A0N5AX40_9BILA
MSPSRKTRLMEKEVLSSLNDRLAVYIDRVRQLEHDNERLNVQIRESEIVEKKERSDLVARYEDKIKELRSLVDEALKEKTRGSMDAKVAFTERDNALAKVAKLEKELKQAEKARALSESLVQDFQGKLNAAEAARRRLEDENKGLAAENTSLNEQLSTLRKQVEDVTLINTAVLNQNQSLKEDFEFLKKTHEDVRIRFYLKRQVEMTTTAREMERTYESRLQEQLQAMREEFDASLSRNRRDIDETYKNKLNEANEARQMANKAREESARLRLRVHELEKALAYAKEDAVVCLQQRDEHIAELQREIDRLHNEYQDLFDLKVQLDTELKAYHNLLEGEETRLNISQQSSYSPSSSPASSTSRFGIKRRRFDTSDDTHFYQNAAKSYKTTAKSTGDVEIESHDTDGKFVKLVNKGEETISIGCWTLKSTANNRETAYRFHTRQSLKPGDSITVYSADSGEKHQPPSQLVMKNQQWPSGDRVKTVLLDAEGNEMTQIGEFGAVEQDPDQRCALM